MQSAGIPTDLAHGRRRRIAVAVLAFMALSLAGCTEKAQTIQLGADQFATESLIAIEKIDQLRRRETTAAPLSQAEASRLFVGADRAVDISAICC